MIFLPCQRAGIAASTGEAQEAALFRFTVAATDKPLKSGCACAMANRRNKKGTTKGPHMDSYVRADKSDG
jgi:hypothetical protein